ncbi:MAG: F0F1 ATP synthase subunit A [Candidatus Saccharimonadales bacterium]
MLQTFAAADLHIEIKAEPIFEIGSFVVTNSMLTGFIGYALVIWLFFAVRRAIKTGKGGYVTKGVIWVFEMLYNTVRQVVADQTLAKKVAPLAITLFFVIIVNYWMGILPGVGTITNADGIPLFRGLVADLNVTFAFAIISMVMAQVYAAKVHGFFGNLGRYLKNPFKDPAGAFEGILELISEFSRLLALSLRLFGNVFAGEVLLIAIGYVAAYFASIALLPFMVFELFIGAIQAYVFFMLTTVFISLGVVSHDTHEASPTDHSPADKKKKLAAHG